MFPVNVDVFGEAVSHAVWQRESHNTFRVIFFKCDVSLATEGDANGEVLSSGFVWLDGGSIMMEWLPLRAVTEPIETGCLNVHSKVVSDSIDHHVEGRAFFLPVLAVVISYQMGIIVPQFPKLVFVYS